MNIFNIYLCGVGGQGIGLLSEVLIQAVSLIKMPVIGADTHGLAQRGGTVSSHIRIGEKAKTPLISENHANVIIGLERLEALRAVKTMLCPDNGTVIYYDAVYQPIHVRAFNKKYPENSEILETVKEKNGIVHKVFIDELPDERMQNVALLAKTAISNAIPGLGIVEIRNALEQTLPKSILTKNLLFFDNLC